MSKFSKLIKNPNAFLNDSPAYQTIRISLSSVKSMSNFQKNVSIESLKNDISSLTEIVVTKESFLKRSLHIGILKGSAFSIYNFMLCLHKEKDIEVSFITKRSVFKFGKLGVYRFIKELNTYGEISCKIGGIKLNISYWLEKGDCYESINNHAVAKRIYKSSSYKIQPFKKGSIFYINEIFPSLPSPSYSFKIDVVYTWVDHTDEVWRKLYLEYKAKQNNSVDSVKLGRFFNRDELKFSLRSLELYAPWVNNIYIVTNCRPPAWLNTKNQRIKIIKHEDIMPKESLPTFNSHAIEANIHNIPNLSNYFLYLNDDFFFSSHVHREDFFLSNGVSISNLEPYGVVNGIISKGNPDYINAAINGQRLLAKKFNITPTQLHQHSPYALRKDILKEICSLYSEETLITTKNKFRSKNDISIPSFLYHHYSYIKRQSSIGRLSSIYIGYKKRVNFNKIINKDIKTFCINDSGSSHSDMKWNENIKYYLERTYRNKSSFEN
ncbi:stealth conserved region 3 domain-containing protein [Aeromonas hydrophila]|uniref:stealth conserved region 3 domain-containing protein n=1 Tax=Aeromonas hydrophila TaxID=644 RepID=UPI0029DE5111|nr:stealth conserved region 3 domain-containing protein [Aeromonas hydrophila]